MATLNTASSVVDFLRGRGFNTTPGETLPLYNTRKQLYENLGLNSTLGDYRGSATQNPALLNSLSKLESQFGVSITPDNLTKMIEAARGGAATPAAPEIPPPAPVTPRQTSTTGAGSTDVGTAVAQPAPEEDFTVPPEIQSRIDSILNPLAGRDLAQEAIDKFTGSPTFPLEQEKAGAQKAAIQLGAQRDTESFIKNIASRGLIFSGAKNVGINNIEVDKMAKLLNIDRNFAMMVTQGLQSAAQDIAKEAQKGSTDAINALEKLGFGLNPLTGAIESTLAARNAAATDRRAAESAAAQEARFQQTEARLSQSANRPIEIDTFTDASGNRITTFMDPSTGELYQENLGQAGRAGSTGTGTGSSGSVGTTIKDAEKKGFTRGTLPNGGIDFKIGGKTVQMDEWLRQSGVSIEDALKGSTQPGDIQFLADYKAGIKAIENGEATAEEIFSGLRQIHPYYTGGFTQQAASSESQQTPEQPTTFSTLYQQAQKGQLDVSKLSGVNLTSDQISALYQTNSLHSGVPGLTSKIANVGNNFFSRLFGR